MNGDSQQGVPIGLQEMYQLIGEREVVRFLMQKRLDELEQKIRWMTEELQKHVPATPPLENPHT